MVFFYYLKEEEKQKEAEKRVEEVEKCFSHVAESLYLSTSKVPQMKERLGRMQVLVETTDEEVGIAPTNDDGIVESNDVAAVDDYEVVISEESYYSCEGSKAQTSSSSLNVFEDKENEERIGNLPPDWPHYATQYGITALSSGEDDDANYWEWPKDSNWLQYATHIGIAAQ
uniref:AlNc14C2565G13258 protein n=1 Tax=Albugo laibachii Nc14 TaxID=890382 RepID=F0X2Y6_9STRA|nr:AlNc14C2565G13258 [Albugo laibachii Nc14]|eukprot:CCA28357.1 AlNc14C2565G13258 [Albugo laibachii Nc14]